MIPHHTISYVIAGGEGLDLVETKNVIICDPGWNEGAIRQVIGRAARYLSHANLPKEKQVVYVYRLFMDKPDNTSGRLSIDIYLRNLAKEKKEMIDKMMNKLDKMSIETNKCN